MKKVLFMIDNLNSGGAEKVLVNILKELDKEKYQIDLFLITQVGVHLEKVPHYININYLISKENDKKIFSKFLRWNIFLKRFLIQKKINKKYDYGISFLEDDTTYILGKLKKISYKIAWIHTDLIKKKEEIQKQKLPYIMKKVLFLTRRLNENSLEKYDKIIAVSNYVKDSIFKVNSNLKIKTEVIYNGFDVKSIIELSRKNIEWEKEKFTFISLGRLEEVKGYKRLIKCVARLKNDIKVPFELLIFGEGSQREELENTIKLNKLQEVIKIKKFIENPYPYLKKADVFVLHSYYEGLPSVLIEAILLETAVVSVNIKSAIEILENYNKKIISNNTEEGIYQALYDSMNEFKNNKKEIVMNKKIFEKFSKEENKNKIERLLE